VYTYTEARQNLATILENAAREGEVRVKRRDGRVFVIKPVIIEKSPLDVAGIDVGLSRDEIVQFVHEGRRTGEAQDGK
jgi:antitoxin Phd